MNKTKIIAIIMAVSAFVLFLTGCASGGNKPQGSTENTTKSTTEKSTEKTTKKTTTSTTSNSKQEMINAYLEEMRDEAEDAMEDHDDNEEMPTCYIYDIDANGVPELIIRTGSTDRDFEFEYYTYDNKIVEIGETEGGYITLAAKDGKLYACSTHDQLSYVEEISIQNGKIKTEVISNDLSYDEIMKQYKKLDGFDADNREALISAIGK